VAGEILAELILQGEEEFSSGMDEAAESAGSLGDDAGGASSGMDDAADSASSLGEGAGGASSGIDDMKQSLSDLESTAGMVGGAGLASAGAAIEGINQSTKETRSSLQQTGLRMGMTGDEANQLARDVSNVTFPIEDATATLKTLSEQGVENKEDMSELATEYDTLADAVGTDAATAAREGGKALRAFGGDVDDVKQKADTFNFVAQNTTLSFEDFTGSVERIAPELQEMGMTMDDTAAVFAALEEKGISGRTAIKEVRQATNEAEGDAQKFREELDLSKDAIDAQSQALERSKGSTQEYADAANSTLTTTDKLRHKFDEVKLAAGGVLDPVEAAGPAMMGLGGAMSAMSTVASASVVPALGSVATAAAPVAVPLLALVAAAGALYVAWDNNFLGIRDITADVIGGIESFLGDLSEWLGKIPTDVEGMKSAAVGSFNALKSGATGAVGGLVSGASQKFDSLKSKAGTKLDSLKSSGVTKAGQLKDGVVSKTTDLKNRAGERIGQLKTRGGELLGDLKQGGVEKLGSFASSGVGELAGLKERGASKIAGMKGAAVSKLASLKEQGVSRLGSLADQGLSRAGKLKDQGLSRLGSLRDQGVSRLNTLKDQGVSRAQGLKNEVTAGLGSLKDEGVSKLSGLKDRGVSKLGSLKDSGISKAKGLKRGFFNQTLKMGRKVSGLVDDMKGAVASKADELKDSAVSKAKSLKRGFFNQTLKTTRKVVSLYSGLYRQTTTKISNMAGTVMDYLTGKKGPLGDLKSAGKALMNTFTEGIENAASAPVDAAKGAVGRVRDVLPGSDARRGPLSDLTDSGRALPTTLAKGMEDKKDRAASAATTIAAAARPSPDATPGAIAAGGGGSSAGGDGTLEAEVDESSLADAFLDALREVSRETDSGDVIVRINDKDVAKAANAGNEKLNQRDVLK